MRRQFLLFMLAGGIAAMVNFLSRIAFSHAAVPYVAAIILAYCVGMATAFVLNRMFVFIGATNPIGQQMLWFVLVNLLAVAQTVLVSLLLARIVFPAMHMTWHVEELAHAIGVIVPIASSFVGHRKLTFRNSA